MSRFIFEGLLFRCSTKRSMHRLRVGVCMASSRGEKLLKFEKVERALGLIGQYAPVKFKALQSDVACILVAGDASTRGQYIHRLRMVELDDDYVLDERTTPEALASILIHEA
jgi:hypothetical protein